MTQLHAQPYDISATGFYFDSVEEYAQKSARNFNNFGAPVEEYEIQFIDGESIDAALFKALNVHQGNFPQFLEACDSWDDSKSRKSLSPLANAVTASIWPQAIPTILKWTFTSWTA